MMLKSAYRNFIRKPAICLVNLAGLAICMVLGFALLTASWQKWRAATKNPSEALRYE